MAAELDCHCQTHLTQSTSRRRWQRVSALGGMWELSGVTTSAHPSADEMATSSLSPPSQSWVVGVDVGTTSARAGVIEVSTGRLIASHSHPILLFHPQPNFYQHSSQDIWSAVCTAVTSALRLAQERSPAFNPALVKGIAFDATCSLVVLGEGDVPISVSPSGERDQNVIVWMDHRAAAEAAFINATHHEVLRYVGGAISVEMEIPKLLWIQRHLPQSFKAATRFLDLADFLSYTATGKDGQLSVQGRGGEGVVVCERLAHV